MAKSPLVDYRREPVLQSRLGEVQDAFDSSASLTTAEKRALRAHIDTAFSNRKEPVVVVKEVTPFLVGDFLEAANPQILHLQRHPLAVARSHIALGWLPHPRLVGRAGIGDRERNLLSELWGSSSDITKLVAYFAAADGSVQPELDGTDAIYISYEALTVGDFAGASGLFKSLGIGVDDLSTPKLDVERTDAYGVGLSRQSRSRDSISSQVAEEALHAWMLFDTKTYRDEATWMPSSA